MYGHAELLLTRCARAGCIRPVTCISDRGDRARICIICAVKEERDDAS